MNRGRNADAAVARWAAAAVAAVLTVGGCAPTNERHAEVTTSPEASRTASRTPEARLNGVPLPVVAARWPGRNQRPPSHLHWSTSSDQDGKPLRVTVSAGAPPQYVSFMAHRRVDGRGIPDEKDARGHDVWACGPGIENPECRITPGRHGRYIIEVTATAMHRHPYRLLYVQWVSSGQTEEKWISWQLPTG